MNLFHNIELLIYSTLLFTPPLLISALGANYTNTSGIINIGLDGLMTVGAFVGCATTYFLKNPFLGLLCAGISSMAFSIIFGVLVLECHVDQILSGFALNIFMPAIIIIISFFLFNSSDTLPLSADLKIGTLFGFLKESDNQIIKFLSNIFSTYITTYISFLLVPITIFVLNKTVLGLYIRACGINGKASIFVGINKTKIQFLCILISGFLYGISGAIMTMAVTNQFRITSICGQGYIALAAVLFSNGSIINILMYCIIFGFFSGLKIIIPSSSGIIHLVQILPYIATILILLISKRKKSNV